MKTPPSRLFCRLSLAGILILPIVPAFSQSSGNSVFGRRRSDTQEATQNPPADSAKQFDFAGTRWKTQHSTIELRADGTWYSSWGNGEYGKWRKINATTIRNDWHEWKLSDDQTELVLFNGSRAKFVERIGESPGAPVQAKTPPAPKATRSAPVTAIPYSESLFSGTVWTNPAEGNSTYSFSPDGTLTETWGTQKKSGRWWHIDKITIRQDYDTTSENFTFTLSEDGTSIKRNNSRNPWHFVSGKKPPANAAAGSFSQELEALENGYEKACAKAIASVNAADLKKIQDLKKEAVARADTILMEKIQFAENAVNAGEQIDMSEPDRKNRPSPGELNLYRLKTARDRAIENAQKAAYPAFKSDCEELKRKALAAGDLSAAGEIDKFILYASGAAAPFIGKWQGFGSTLELRKNFTCIWQGGPDGTWRIIGKNTIEHTNREPKKFIYRLADRETMTKDGGGHFKRK